MVYGTVRQPFPPQAMPFDTGTQLSLRGSLILADPSLRDPSFARSVLILTDHRHDQGAHGYILNRPAGRTVGDLLTTSEFEDLADIPVLLGGPVSQEHLTFASFRWDDVAREMQSSTHLNVVEAIDRRKAGETVYAFAGYSGWAGGQLESELRQRAWIPHRPESFVLRSGRLEDLWHEILSGMGPWFRLLAGTPEDPSLN